MAEPLNYLDPGFPQSEWTGAFRAFETVLRNDAVLSARVTTWVTYRGEDVDQIFADKLPTADQCPFLLMGPFPTSSDMITESEHYMPLTVRLRLAVQGTNSDHIMNFARAIVTALYPQDDPVLRGRVQSALLAWQVVRPVIRLAAFGTTVDDPPVMVADGSIEFGMKIRT